MPNLIARRTRIETLDTLIDDAYRRIKTHKDDIEYVNEQKDFIRDWQSERDYLDTASEVVGYFVQRRGQNFLYIVCPKCKVDAMCDTLNVTDVRPTPVHDVNIHPYTQPCHACGEILYQGTVTTILFEKE